MMSKTIMIAAIAAVVVVGGGVGAAVYLLNDSDDTIIIASSPDFTPYDYMVGDDWTGIDMDICKGVFDKLGMKYEFKSVQFDSIVPGVQSGKYTMGASGFSITEERMESVIFSEPYSKVFNVAVVKIDAPDYTLDDLKASGVKNGVQNGTTGHLIANDKLGAEHVLSLSTYSDVFKHLGDGKVTSIILDRDTAVSFINGAEDAGKYKILEIIPGDIENYAFVFSKDNTELRDKFNTALAELKADGTIDKIKTYYEERAYSSETISYWKYIEQQEKA